MAETDTNTKATDVRLYDALIAAIRANGNQSVIKNLLQDEGLNTVIAMLENDNLNFNKAPFYNNTFAQSISELLIEEKASPEQLSIFENITTQQQRALKNKIQSLLNETGFGRYPMDSSGIFVEQYGTNISVNENKYQDGLDVSSGDTPFSRDEIMSAYDFASLALTKPGMLLDVFAYTDRSGQHIFQDSRFIYTLKMFGIDQNDQRLVEALSGYSESEYMGV